MFRNNTVHVNILYDQSTGTDTLVTVAKKSGRSDSCLVLSVDMIAILVMRAHIVLHNLGRRDYRSVTSSIMKLVSSAFCRRVVTKHTARRMFRQE